SCFSLFCSLRCSPLFPYTTLFRSVSGGYGRSGDQPVFHRLVFLPGRHQQYLSVAERAYLPGLLCLLHWTTEVCDRFGNISEQDPDRKSTRLNSSHVKISYAVFCLK